MVRINKNSSKKGWACLMEGKCFSFSFCKFSRGGIFDFFIIICIVAEHPQGNLEHSLRVLYNDVQTFVFFIGYARSGHSLIGAVLDAHPEIMISNYYPRNTIDRWDDYKRKSKGRNDSLKIRLFFDIHSMSQFHAMAGKRASSWSCVAKNHRYCYNVPGQWQGTYRDKLKVGTNSQINSGEHSSLNPASSNFQGKRKIARNSGSSEHS